jgi:transcriptional regulator with XRE-family HTH domain
MQISDKFMVDAELLGQKIRLAREQSGLSQEELAGALDLGQRAISELENGKRRLSVQELLEMARVLHKSVLYFLEDEIQPSDLDQLLLQHFHRISSQAGRQTVVEVVRLLSETMK